MLQPATKQSLTKYEKIELVHDLKEIHEHTRIAIVFNKKSNRWEVRHDAQCVGEVYECSECGYKYEALSEGGSTWEIETCWECGAQTWQ